MRDSATTSKLPALFILSFKKTATPPYKPEVQSETDTSNFDEVEIQPLNGNKEAESHFIGKCLPFLSFSYSGNSPSQTRPMKSHRRTDSGPSTAILTARLQDAQAKMDAVLKRETELESRLKTSELECITLGSDKSRLLDETHKASATVKSLTESERKHKEESQKVQNTLTSLRNELNSQKDINHSTLEAKGQAEAQCDKLSAELVKSQKKLEAKSQELQGLLLNASREHTDGIALKQEMDALNATIVRLQTEHAEALASDRELTSTTLSQKLKLEEKIAELRQTHLDYQHQVQERDQQHLSGLDQEHKQTQKEREVHTLLLKQQSERFTKLQEQMKAQTESVEEWKARSERYSLDANKYKQAAEENAARTAALKSKLGSLEAQHANGDEGGSNQHWQGRRVQKLDKLELRNMQQQRDEEVRAKVQAEQRLAMISSGHEAQMEKMTMQMNRRIQLLESSLETTRLELEHARSDDSERVGSPGPFSERRMSSPSLDLNGMALPEDDKPSILGCDLAKITGTGSVLSYQRLRRDNKGAYQGWVTIPKPGGVRKGWRQMWFSASGGKISLYEKSAASRRSKDKSTPKTTPGMDEATEPGAYIVLDLRQPNFSVTSVEQADVIHASSKDLPRIFKFSFQGLGDSEMELLVLAESVELKQRIMNVCISLHSKALATEKPENLFSCADLGNMSAFAEIKHIACAARVGNRLFVGASSGLFAVSSDKVTMIGDLKKVTQVEAAMGQASFVVMASKGKVSQLYLFGINAALRGRDDGLKISESKGTHLFSLADCGDRARLVFAVRNRVMLCEVQPQRYEVIGSFDVDGQPSMLGILNSKIAVGHRCTFTAFDWQTRRPYPLVNPAEKSLEFLARGAATPTLIGNDIQPIACFELAVAGEQDPSTYLLCFNYFGLFVNEEGKRNQSTDLVFSGKVSSVHMANPYIVCLGENFVEIIDLTSGNICQVVPIEAMSTLSQQSMLCLSTGTNFARVMYIQDTRTPAESWMLMASTGAVPERRSSSRFNFRSKKKPDTSRIATRQISAPSDFQHVSHIGQEEIQVDQLVPHKSPTLINKLRSCSTPERATPPLGPQGRSQSQGLIKISAPGSSSPFNTSPLTAGSEDPRLRARASPPISQPLQRAVSSPAGHIQSVLQQRRTSPSRVFRVSPPQVQQTFGWDDNNVRRRQPSSGDGSHFIKRRMSTGSISPGADGLFDAVPLTTRRLGSGSHDDLPASTAARPRRMSPGGGMRPESSRDAALRDSLLPSRKSVPNSASQSPTFDHSHLTTHQAPTIPPEGGIRYTSGSPGTASMLAPNQTSPKSSLTASPKNVEAPDRDAHSTTPTRKRVMPKVPPQSNASRRLPVPANARVRCMRDFLRMHACISMLDFLDVVFVCCGKAMQYG